MLRDQIEAGDLAFFYHSNCDPPGIAGMMRIVRAGYPDDTAWNPEHKYYDPKSRPDKPRWYRVDVAFVEKFPRFLSLAELKACPELSAFPLLRRGNRLSIMPVSAAEWAFICNDLGLLRK